jgi:hypothetical protein
MYLCFKLEDFGSHTIAFYFIVQVLPIQFEMNNEELCNLLAFLLITHKRTVELSIKLYR